MKRKIIIGIIGICLIIGVTLLSGCDQTGSNAQENAYQDQIMEQSATEIGMPEITEFYEKKMAKEIWEMRDDSSLICYAYTKNEMSGKYVYEGKCMGYGLPYSTQYTNPDEGFGGSYGYYTLPQADPNGLYSSDGLSATWLMMIDEDTGERSIRYIEPEIVVAQTKIPARLVEDWSLTADY